MLRKLYILVILFCSHLGPAAFAQQLKVISYNIHHGADKDEKLTLDEIGEFIKGMGADLVGLQEVDSLCNRSGNVDQMKRLSEITGMHCAFVRHFAYDGGAYGLGLLSRYPLSDIRNDRITSKVVDGQQRSLALLSAEVTIAKNKKVRLATVHFALDQQTRMIQAGETIDYLMGDIPVILTGDLNAEPDNAVLKRLGKHFSSTVPSSEYTFPVDGATKTIDYIMVSTADLDEIIQAEAHAEIHHSDHLPLSSTFLLRKASDEK